MYTRNISVSKPVFPYPYLVNWSPASGGAREWTSPSRRIFDLGLVFLGGVATNAVVHAATVHEGHDLLQREARVARDVVEQMDPEDLQLFMDDG